MKKLFLLPLAAICIVAHACQEPGQTDGEAPKIIAEQELQTGPQAASLSLGYRIGNPSEGSSLTAVSDDSWISAVSVTADEVSFQVAENTGTAERSGTVTLSYPEAEDLKVTVRQQAAAAKPEILADTGLEAGCQAAEYSVPYSIANPVDGCELSASAAADWITEVRTDSDNISFKVAGNASGAERQGTITLSYPGADNAELKVTQPSLEFQDLCKGGTANCYIISEPGTYGFLAVKGNSDETVGEVASAEVLWESYGTDIPVSRGDLIESVSAAGDRIFFTTADPLPEGNATIAAKDSEGTVLWSWHIWITDRPLDQQYNNNAGIMMDRNLGATSAEAGSVESLGLLYQWGRKDPFLGSSSISEGKKAESSIEWPAATVSTQENGTIEYSVEHPTVFIICNTNNYDWFFNTAAVTDNTRWTSSKTIYDPCPEGYRVPDGGNSGVWSKAFGNAGPFDYEFDQNFRGYDFGSSSACPYKLTDTPSCWYPAAGYVDYGDGTLHNVGNNGCYWTCTPYSFRNMHTFNFYFYGAIAPSYDNTGRADGQSVRCVRE